METNIPWISSFNNKNLELILFVTEQCNFRCLYCYEDFKLGKMLPEIIEGVKNLIIKRINGIEVLNLSFFGGEPLLNKPAIFEISNWAGEICKLNDVKYFAAITTNGYSLDKESFSKLIHYGVSSFQITLDGEKNEHNKFRRGLNGKDTFDKIYLNLVAMAKSNYSFTCKIRFNIADSNFISIQSFINYYSEPFVNDVRFTFHFHPIFGMPEYVLSKSQQLAELKEFAEKKGFQHSSPDKYGLCYAARADSFVIRANGRIQKCTVALANEINNIGNLLKDGSMNIDQKKFKKWIFAENKSCPVQSLTLEKLVIPYENSGKYVNDVSI